MLRLSLNIFKLKTNHLFHTAAVCNDQISKVTKNNLITEIPFFMKIFGLNQKKTHDILIENPQLLKISKEDIIETAFLLKTLNIPLEQLWERPIILATSSSTVENRFTILQECGFHNIDIIILNRYLSIMNKNTNILKAHGLIKNEINIKYLLLNQLNINTIHIKENINSDDNITLNILRKVILDIYLKNKLNLKNSDIDKLWKVYPRIKHKSYLSITEAIKFFKSELNFSNDRIIHNGYLLHSDPKNLKNILNKIDTLGDINIREVISRYPKIMMTNCDSIIKIVKYVHAFNIPNTSIAKCFEIFTLGPETVYERLIDLKKVKEFNVLVQHPRILRLVHYQNKARLRLDYLRQLKVKCVSLHILSTNAEAFERYARDGTDKTKGRDVTILLEQLLKVDEAKIRSIISRHPNWCHVPITSVKQTFDYLINKGFTIDTIVDNIHLLMYSVDRIDAEIVKIEKKYNFHLDGNTNNNSMTPSQILGLCLYYIEVQYHFTGDGIWLDTMNQSNDTSIVHPPELPKELVKKYKYGMKPTTNITYSNKTLCM